MSVLLNPCEQGQSCWPRRRSDEPRGARSDGVSRYPLLRNPSLLASSPPSPSTSKDQYHQDAIMMDNSTPAHAAEGSSSPIQAASHPAPRSPGSTPEHSSTQHTIKSLLSISSSDQRSTEALATLHRLEKRAVPAGTPVDRVATLSGKACCFDVESSEPSWCANRLCERCIALDQVLQGERLRSLGPASRGAARRHLAAALAQSLKVPLTPNDS